MLICLAFGFILDHKDIIINSKILLISNITMLSLYCSNVSRTLNIEALYNITTMALNNTGSHLLVANESQFISILFRLDVDSKNTSKVIRFRRRDPLREHAH